MKYSFDPLYSFLRLLTYTLLLNSVDGEQVKPVVDGIEFCNKGLLRYQEPYLYCYFEIKNQYGYYFKQYRDVFEAKNYFSFYFYNRGAMTDVNCEDVFEENDVRDAVQQLYNYDSKRMYCYIKSNVTNTKGIEFFTTPHYVGYRKKFSACAQTYAYKKLYKPFCGFCYYGECVRYKWWGLMYYKCELGYKCQTHEQCPGYLYEMYLDCDW